MKYKHQFKPPELQWNKHGHPVSVPFKDVYYSAANGLAETDHVFISGNHLIQRFHELRAMELFTVFECGFGTGLNFLRTYWHWQRQRAQGQLRFCSLEAQPLSVEQLEQALMHWREHMPEQIEQLLSHYTELQYGFNQLQLSDRVVLDILVCDVNDLNHETLKDLSIDAIFMDGFAPSRNPDMWTSQLCELLFHLSHPGTTLATYSVAGMVRRNLTAAGFSIEKVPGFGNKREMLTAYKAAN